MPMHGQCNCEAIKVTIQDQSDASAATVYCHCANCRRQSGAVGTCVFVVDEKDAKIEGPLKDYLDKNTTSGTPMNRYFCGECGT